MLLLIIVRRSPLAAQQSQSTFTPPDDVAFRTATIISEGTRMAAEVFAPKSPATDKLPTIVMAHGWGGVAANLRADAVRSPAPATWW